MKCEDCFAAGKCSGVCSQMMGATAALLEVFSGKQGASSGTPPTTEIRSDSEEQPPQT